MSILYTLISVLAITSLLYLYTQGFMLEKEQPYMNAIQFMSLTLASVTNTDEHHFQPCKGCGYPLQIKKDRNYCKVSDTYKLLHHDSVLGDLSVFRDYGAKDLARQIIRGQMFDILPQYEQQSIGKNMFSLSKLMSVNYPYAKNYFRTHMLGYEGGCIFTKYMHVLGQEEISLKSNSSTHFVNYIQSMEKQEKSQQCIKDAQYFKKTYRMWDRQECQQIFDILSSIDYQNDLNTKGIKYIFKTNRHLGNGILILDINNEQIIRSWYADGNKCGRNQSQVIIQEYVTNPYLYNGHKMEFRAYFTIASTSPHMLYGYKRALIKQCALSFNLMDFTKQGHVCNTAVVRDHKANTNNDDDDDLYIDWNLEELQDLLLSQGRINSTTWLEDYLLPQMYRKMTHLYLSVKGMMFEDSRFGEFFGVDFLLDDDFVLWIFECNRNPNFLAVTEGRKEKFGRLIPDMIELQWRLVKSKFVRVRQFVRDNLHFFREKQVDRVQVSRLRKEFLQLQTDRLEPQYELPKDSLLQLVYIGDESLGAKQSLFVDPDCLNH